jgi:hypothetical protein
LQVLFSEPIRLPLGTSHPLQSISVLDGTRYRFELIDPVGAPSKSGDLYAVRFVVAGGLADIPGQVFAPKEGDSLWIDPLAGVSDTVGNIQKNPGNVRVPILLLTNLNYKLTSPSPGGVAHIMADLVGPNWSVFGGSGLTGTIGTSPYALPVTNQPESRGQSGGLTLESTQPFFFELVVLDNLGHFVSRAKLDVQSGDFVRLPQGTTPGSRQLSLLWRGRTDDGRLAGTGAYVYLWKIAFTDAEGRQKNDSGKRIQGLLRF